MPSCNSELLKSSGTPKPVESRQPNWPHLDGKAEGGTVSRSEAVDR
ncbi:MAG: hypothetical protein H6817_03435 [Phycisphaerales bacterium]|nr:hypothetical protein [Phycisphaerales bacterium]